MLEKWELQIIHSGSKNGQKWIRLVHQHYRIGEPNSSFRSTQIRFSLAARIYYILYFSCFIPAHLISNFTRIFNRNTFIVINSYRLTLLVINHHHKIRKSDAKCCHTKADQFKKTFGSKLPNFASSIYQFLVLIFEHITENFPDEILENQM